MPQKKLEKRDFAASMAMTEKILEKARKEKLYSEETVFVRVHGWGPPKGKAKKSRVPSFGIQGA